MYNRCPYVLELPISRQLLEEVAKDVRPPAREFNTCLRTAGRQRSYEASCTWNRRIRACTDSHCTSLYLVYLPARTGSLITTRLPPRSRSASRPALLLPPAPPPPRNAVDGTVTGIFAIFVTPDEVSDVKRLSALLTTPLHSRGQALAAR